MQLNTIEGWYEPTEFLRSFPGYKKHMSRNDHGFLSALINKIRPKKILEIGVAEGGTTAMIIKTLEMLNLECEMISIDLAEEYHGEKIGSMLSLIEIPQNVRHTLITRKLLVNCIDEIGGDIDMVIIDTTHVIPGEILEFLTVLPFMSNRGTIVLHDVNLANKYAQDDKRMLTAVTATAPKILFSSVTGDKFYNYEPGKLNNISAFQINELTTEYIDDIFYILSFIWLYDLPDNVLNTYREFFEKHYSEKCLELFDLFTNNMKAYRKNIDLRAAFISSENNILPKFIFKKKIKKKIWGIMTRFMTPSNKC